MFIYLREDGRTVVYYRQCISFEGMRMWKSMGFTISLKSISQEYQ